MNTKLIHLAKRVAVAVRERRRTYRWSRVFKRRRRSVDLYLPGWCLGVDGLWYFSVPSLVSLWSDGNGDWGFSLEILGFGFSYASCLRWCIDPTVYEM